MATFKFPRILVFINGPVPTEQDYALAERFGLNTTFRNAAHVPPEGALEKCDGVTGAVPARYAAAFPPAEEALEAFMLARQKRAGLLQEAAKGEDVPKAAPAPKSPAESPKQGKKAAVVWEPNKAGDKE